MSTTPLSTDLAFQATVQTATPTPKHMADTLIGLTELDGHFDPFDHRNTPGPMPFVLPTRPRQTFGGSR